MGGRALDREREFHDQLAESGFAPRRLVHRMTEGLYDVSVYWEPVWRAIRNEVRGKRVLEIGCGSGWMVAELVRMGAWVYGVDISSGLLNLARRRMVESNASGRWCFVVADAHRLPFPDGSFDFVFGSGILHHLDFERACLEVARVLCPGGRSFFVEPLDRHPLVRLFRWLTPRARTPDEKPLDFVTIMQARSRFAYLKHHEYYLISVAVGAINLISPKLGRAVLSLTRKIDDRLLSKWPWLRQYAWITRLELYK